MPPKKIGKRKKAKDSEENSHSFETKKYGLRKRLNGGDPDELNNTLEQLKNKLTENNVESSTLKKDDSAPSPIKQECVVLEEFSHESDDEDFRPSEVEYSSYGDDTPIKSKNNIRKSSRAPATKAMSSLPPQIKKTLEHHTQDENALVIEFSNSADSPENSQADKIDLQSQSIICSDRKVKENKVPFVSIGMGDNNYVDADYLKCVQSTTKSINNVDAPEIYPEYNVQVDEEMSDPLEKALENTRNSRNELDALMAKTSDFAQQGYHLENVEEGNALQIQNQPEIYKSVFTSDDVIVEPRSELMNLEEKLQLEEQMRMYVQILTQVYLLSHGSPVLEFINHTSKSFLGEIKTFASRNVQSNQSAFNSHNLDEALKIVNTFGRNTILDVKSEKNSRKHSIPIPAKRVIAKSKVFMYPELLPRKGFEPPAIVRNMFTDAEDHLVAIGLEQFSSLDYKVEHIQKYLVPIKNIPQIVVRIKECIEANVSEDNPIKYYHIHKVAPPTPVVVNSFHPNKIKAPFEYPAEILPMWMGIYCTVANRPKCINPNLTPNHTLNSSQSVASPSFSSLGLHQKLPEGNSFISPRHFFTVSVTPNPKEDISHNIKCTLPMLTTEELKAIINILTEIGVNEKQDLKYVRETDLATVLKPIQCRRLIESWKDIEFEISKESGILINNLAASDMSINNLPKIEASISNPPVTEAIVNQPSKSLPRNDNLSCDWVENYQIPWHQMSQDFSKALKEKKRPDLKCMEEFVNVVSETIYAICPRPSKADLMLIARMVNKAYPASFSKFLCGSLTKSLMVKFSHLNKCAPVITPPNKLTSNWVKNYKIPWHKMSFNLLEALKNKKRLNPRCMREFVNVVSYSIYAICPKPGKSNLRLIARQAAKAYPSSFSEFFFEEFIADGSESLTNRLESKFDNIRIRNPRLRDTVPDHHVNETAITNLPISETAITDLTISETSITDLPVSETATTNLPSNSLSSNNKLSSDWVESYKIPWHKMSFNLLEALKNKKRVNPRCVREFVNVVSDSIYAICPKPGRQNLRLIAQQAAEAYPSSFSEFFFEEFLGDGSEFLTKRLEFKFSNLRNTNPPIRDTVPDLHVNETAITDLPISETSITDLPVSKTATTNLPSNSLSSNNKLSSNWVESYKIPWHLMSCDLLKLLKEKKTLDKKYMTEFLNVVSESVYAICSKPRKAKLRLIARQAGLAYPTSFNDILSEENESLTRALEVKFENLNRKKLKESSNDLDKLHKRMIKSDKFDCVNYQPTILPEGETLETLELKREKMIEIFSIHKTSAVSKMNAMELLKQTYYRQRFDINSLTETCTLLKSWPLLFTEVGLLMHFETLVGVNIKCKLSESMDSKGKKILEFFKNEENQTPKMKELFSNIPDVSLQNSYIPVILLIMEYFEENLETLFSNVEYSVASRDIERIQDLPCTPYLIRCDVSWASTQIRA